MKFSLYSEMQYWGGKSWAQLYDEVLEHHGDVQNFASLLRCSCLLYVANANEPRVAAPSMHCDLVAAE